MHIVFLKTEPRNIKMAFKKSLSLRFNGHFLG